MGVSYADVIRRMKEVSTLKNDSRVAKSLGVTPQALSNYKKKGSMPSNLIFRFADIYNLSVDWLISGEGNPFRSGSAAPTSSSNAAEDVAAYGEEFAGNMTKITGAGLLNADEVIYIGKLLKIMRSTNAGAISAVKCNLDAFLKSLDAEAASLEPSVEDTQPLT